MQERATARAPLWLQIVAMFLVASLPVVWLIGRRSGPPPGPLPLLLGPSDPRIVLTESPRGLAGGAPPTRLPGRDLDDASYVLAFTPRGAADEDAPPYRVRTEGPDGRSLYQGTYEEGIEPGATLECVLPAGTLRPGRHAVVVVDSRGIVRTYPFIVPEPDTGP